MAVPHLPVRDQVAAILRHDHGFSNREVTVALAIMGGESNGQLNAKNTESSASGIFQFIDSTYDGYARRVIEAQPALASVMADKNSLEAQTHAYALFVRDNMQSLTNKGLELTPGNIYAAHFLGQAGAGKVLRSDDSTRLATLVSSDVMEANASVKFDGKPFAQFTVGDFKRWTEKKMSSNGAAAALSLSWAGVLESSPEQVGKELEAIGSQEALALKERIAGGSTDKDTLEQAADLIRSKVKDELTEAGVTANGSALSLAELVGGHAAAQMLKLSPEERKGKKASEFVDAKVLGAYQKLSGSGIEGKDLASLTVDEFLNGVDAKQKSGKQAVVDSLDDSNPLKGMLEGAMDDMGLMGFIMIFLMAFAMQAMQANREQQQEQPGFHTLPHYPQQFEGLPGVQEIRAQWQNGASGAPSTQPPVQDAAARFPVAGVAADQKTPLQIAAAVLAQKMGDESLARS